MSRTRRLWLRQGLGLGLALGLGGGLVGGCLTATASAASAASTASPMVKLGGTAEPVAPTRPGAATAPTTPATPGISTASGSSNASLTAQATAAPASAGAAAVPTAGRFPLVWPTPNPAWAAGKPPSQWLQHAGSGDPESGGFGGVRSGGRHFHEGIDIRAYARDRRGEPTDDVMAAMPGIVRHINSSAGDSSYGRYIVLEHPGMSPAVYTLYAHLSRIAPGLRTGQAVTLGQVIATMGHSSGGYMIPVDRSHLHFEIGVAITQNFQGWYDARRYGSRNDHGMWNGMNLVGVNPLNFFDDWRAGRIASAQDFFAKMETCVVLRLATYKKPDFVTRYPALLTKPMPFGPVAGWEIRFNWTGLPFSWTPLTSAEVAGLTPGQPKLVEVNAALERREKSKSLAVERRGTWTPGKDLEIVLQQLFGM